MNIKRGDVFLARFPHASGDRGKKRPVVIVQADAYNHRLRHAVVLQMTTNLNDQNDPACLFIAANSNEGRAAGLTRNSVASGYLISLMSVDRLKDHCGHLSDLTMRQIDDCLKAALGIS